MRPNLKDVIALVKSTGHDIVYFKIERGEFYVLSRYEENSVRVEIGRDIRKSVKKGLDSLERMNSGNQSRKTLGEDVSIERDYSEKRRSNSIRDARVSARVSDEANLE